MTNRSLFPGALGWHGRLAIAAILTAIVFMAAIAMVAFTLYQRVAFDLVIERDQRLVFLSASRVRDELSKLSSNLEDVSRDPDVYGMDPAAQARILRADAPDLTVFDGGVVVLDTFGRVRTTVPERLDLKGEDWSDKDVFRSHLTGVGFAVSDAFRSGRADGETVALSVPILNADREFVGVLAGLFKLGSNALSPLYASIVRLRIGQSGSTYVVDGDGRILYDSELGEVGVPIADRGPLEMALQPEARAWRTSDVAGHDIVAASSGIPGTTWVLVSEEDAAALGSGVLGYRRLLYTLMILGIVLPAAGVAFMMRRGWHTGGGDVDRWGEMPSPRPPQLGGWQVVAGAQGGETSAETVDFRVEEDGRLLVLMAHASGERATAELLASARAALRIASTDRTDLGEALGAVNRSIGPFLSGHESVAGMLARLDPVDGTLEHACASYPSPISSSEVQASEDGLAPALAGSGLSGAAESRWALGSCTLNGRDAMLLAGPGLLELTDEFGAHLRLEDLRSALGAGVSGDQELSDALVEAMCAFAGRKRVGRATWSFAIIARRPPNDAPVSHHP